MELEHIEFSKLKISKTNMRYRDPAPDVSDILPSIREKGVLVPLIVRPEDGKYGVVAGRRRWFSLKTIKDETGEVEAPPCAVMAESDDAEAIEASLLENVARRDPDPMREYETFVCLIKEGRTIDGIAATFGLTPTQVRQRLALGNLLPKIRDAYRTDKIDDETVRHLTMASVAQQRKWLRLFNDPKQHCPLGWQLKQWLFGGEQIATSHALFKLSDYTGTIVEDLFGVDRYFADADLFWALQNRTIAEKRDAFLKTGWTAVEILEVGQRFQQYEHVKVPKKKGGKVFIEVHRGGAVQIFDGWLSQKDVRKLAKAEARETNGKKPSIATGPVMTKALENYTDLHRHLAVRQALIADPQVAFRLAVAHLAAPSGNWSVRRDPQAARSHAIRTTVENSKPQAAFAAEERAVQVLLGWPEADDEEWLVCRQTIEVFAHLLTLTDGEVLRIAAFYMARSLEAGSDVVEDAGARLNVDAREFWQADDIFFDLIRDRATANALLSDVAGEAVAKANVAEKAKLQKQITRDYLMGTNGRAKVENWLPAWLEFPGRGVGQGVLPAAVPCTEIEPDRIAAE